MSADFQAQLANQPATKRDLSIEERYAESILATLEIAEKIHLPGTHDHAHILGTALVSKWPQIKMMLEKAAGRYRGGF